MDNILYYRPQARHIPNAENCRALQPKEIQHVLVRMDLGRSLYCQLRLLFYFYATAQGTSESAALLVQITKVQKAFAIQEYQKSTIRSSLATLIMSVVWWSQPLTSSG